MSSGTGSQTLLANPSPPHTCVTNLSSSQVASWRGWRIIRPGLVAKQTGTERCHQRPQNRRETFWSVISDRTGQTVFTKCVSWTLMPSPTLWKKQRSVCRRQKGGRSGCTCESTWGRHWGKEWGTGHTFPLLGTGSQTLLANPSPPHTCVTNLSSSQVASWRGWRIIRPGLVAKQTGTERCHQRPQNRRETFWSVISDRTGQTVFTKCVSWTLMPSPTLWKKQRSVCRRQKGGRSGCTCESTWGRHWGKEWGTGHTFPLLRKVQ